MKIDTINYFLELLGYQEGDKVCLRLIKANKEIKGYPNAKNQTLTYPIKFGIKHTPPYNLYYVVNGQGHKASEIKFARALFCEFDDLPLNQQKDFWQKYDLPEPTIQVFTGGKSIHSYWVFSQPIEIHHWKPLITDLIELTGADKANKDAPRLLRLPSIPYCDKSGKFNGKVSKIVGGCQKKYSYVELRNAIPTSEKTIDNQSITDLTVENLTKLIYDILPYIPHRQSGSRTYQEYRGFFNAIKNEISENYAISLAEKICPTNENWSQIISSSNGKHNIGTIINFGKKHGFDYQQWRQQNLPQQSSSQQQNLPKQSSPRQKLNQTYEQSNNDTNELAIIKLTQQLIDKLSNPTITDDVRDSEIAIFCNQHRTSERAIRLAIQSKINRGYELQEEEDLSDYLDALIKIPKIEIDLGYVLGDYIATVFEEQAKAIPTNPMALFTCFLPMIANAIGTRVRILVNQQTNFLVRFILRTAIVADSGKAKSAVLNIATFAIEEDNKRLMARYKEEKKAYDELSDEEKKKSPKPVKKQYLLKDFTFEGLYKILAENQQGNCLVKRDELKGYFDSLGKFNTNSFGDDKQKDLELFEGEAIIKTRQDESITYFIPESAVSFVGCLQWFTLSQIFNAVDDITGISARWLFFIGDLPDYQLMNRDCENDESFFTLTSSLYRLLREKDDLCDLLISDEAYAYLQDWFNIKVCGQRQHHNYLQALSKHNKIVGDVIKLAGILHFIYLELVPEWVDNATVINLTTMERAVYLGNYYLISFIYALVKCQENGIDAHLTRILEFVNKKGEVTAKDVYLSNNSRWKKLKMTISDIGKLMLKLVEMGKVERIPTSKGVRIKAKSP